MSSVVDDALLDDLNELVASAAEIQEILTKLYEVYVAKRALVERLRKSGLFPRGD